MGERLKDKVAIVTGGAYGLGQAYCNAMAEQGAGVVVVDINYEKAQDTAKVIQSKGGVAVAIKADVSSPESTLEMAQETFKRFNRIDILVNNAAIFGRVKISRLPFDQITLDDWNRVLSVNLTGVFLACKAVVPYMKKQKSGKIINISTAGIFTGHTNYLHYVAAKGAIAAITKSLARELGEFNINVNCIAPGSTLTEDPNDQEALKRRQATVSARAIKRIEYPSDIVGSVIFFASKDSDFVTGQTLIVDGGSSML